MKNTDLHVHSYYSDGHTSPKDLVKLAKKRKIKYLALTDHDSVKGVKEALKEGKKQSIIIIPSVEISCDNGDVLGYFIDINNKELNKKLIQSTKKVQIQIKNWCNKLNKAGYDITFKELDKKYPKAKGNLNSFYPLFFLYLKGYGKPMELKNKLKKYRKKKIKELTILQAIELIKNAGGVPVLAHPWLGDVKKNFKQMKRFVEAGLKGLELNNGDTFPFKKKGTNEKIRKAAKKYNLILTSGSDYHGEELINLMPGNHSLGKNNCDEKIVKELKKSSKD
jgi:hypothetical protein